MEQYMKVLRTYGRMSAPLKQALQEGAQRLLLQTNDVIQAEGSSGDHFYFIEKGLVRAFDYVKQKEDTLWFKKENEFILQVKGLFDNPATSVIIEAVEDCTLWAFPADLVKRLSGEFLEFNYHVMNMVMEDLVSTDKRIKLERFTLASDKYDWFRQHSPDVMDRAPAKYLASFIGISEKEFRHLQQSKMKLHLPKRSYKKHKDS